jgi:hypothetical protein
MARLIARYTSLTLWETAADIALSHSGIGVSTNGIGGIPRFATGEGARADVRYLVNSGRHLLNSSYSGF